MAGSSKSKGMSVEASDTDFQAQASDEGNDLDEPGSDFEVGSRSHRVRTPNRPTVTGKRKRPSPVKRPSAVERSPAVSRSFTGPTATFGNARSPPLESFHLSSQVKLPTSVNPSPPKGFQSATPTPSPAINRAPPSVFQRSSTAHVEGSVAVGRDVAAVARPSTEAFQMPGSTAHLASASRAIDLMPPPALGPSNLLSQGNLTPSVNPSFGSTQRPLPPLFHQRAPVTQPLSAVPQAPRREVDWVNPVGSGLHQDSRNQQAQAPASLDPPLGPGWRYESHWFLNRTDNFPTRRSVPLMPSYPEDFGYIGAGFAIPVAPQLPESLPVVPYRRAATTTPAGVQPSADDTIDATPSDPALTVPFVHPASQAQIPQGPPSPPPKSSQ